MIVEHTYPQEVSAPVKVAGLKDPRLRASRVRIPPCAICFFYVYHLILCTNKTICNGFVYCLYCIICVIVWKQKRIWLRSIAMVTKRADTSSTIHPNTLTSVLKVSVAVLPTAMSRRRWSVIQKKIKSDCNVHCTFHIILVLFILSQPVYNSTATTVKRAIEPPINHSTTLNSYYKKII